MLQAIGTLTTLTSLRLIRSNDERCSFYEGSGRDFSDLQALSSLKRLSSLESRQLGRGSHNQQDDGDGLLLHKPTREELSSWFPQLQRLYYVRCEQLMARQACAVLYTAGAYACSHSITRCPLPH